MKLILYSLLAATFFLSLELTAEENIGQTATKIKSKQSWRPPASMLEKYDWIKLTSDEWLKGELTGFADRQFEFDSDQLDKLRLDQEDVAEVLTYQEHSLRLLDRRIVRGNLVIDGNTVKVIKDNKTEIIQRYMIVSIAAAAGLKEINYWSGNVSFGMTLREGNTNQKDALVDLDFQRRTAQSRLINTYIGNFTEQSGFETTNNHRANSGFDWFLSHRLFWRVATIEYFRDRFQNTDSRITASTEMGYMLFDEQDFSWEISGGPGYQVTKFDSVEAGEDDKEETVIVTASTELDWDITNDINYIFDYNAKSVSRAAGSLIHHLKTGLKVELIKNFNIELMYYWDRIEQPVADDVGIVPQNDDKRFVVSVGYEF
jgi:putative salt-induced outer membrane protein YdiY